MTEHDRERLPESDEKKVIYLELIAATSILFIVAMVLYMVFTYRPA